MTAAYDKETGITLLQPQGCETSPHDILEAIRSRRFGRQSALGYAIANYARHATPKQREALDKLLKHYSPSLGKPVGDD